MTGWERGGRSGHPALFSASFSEVEGRRRFLRYTVFCSSICFVLVPFPPCLWAIFVVLSSLHTILLNSILLSLSLSLFYQAVSSTSTNNKRIMSTTLQGYSPRTTTVVSAVHRHDVSDWDQSVEEVFYEEVVGVCSVFHTLLFAACIIVLALGMWLQ